MRLRGQVEPQFSLILNFAKDLHQFLQTPSDVVCIRELCELPRDLLCLQESQGGVLAHALIVSVAVLISAQNEVNIVSERRPDTRSLAVEHIRGQKVEQVVI